MRYFLAVPVIILKIKMLKRCLPISSRAFPVEIVSDSSRHKMSDEGLRCDLFLVGT